MADDEQIPPEINGRAGGPDKPENFLLRRRGLFRINILEMLSLAIALIAVLLSAGSWALDILLNGMRYHSPTGAAGSFAALFVSAGITVQYLRTTQRLYRWPVHVLAILTVMAFIAASILLVLSYFV